MATYRLQLSASFKIADARALVPYLASLGVSHLYLSPLLAARAGSTHGYDVVDHGRIDPALGNEDDLVALAAAASERGLGLIIDVVPNHMCVADPANARWRDVLENGMGSVWNDFFDIDWGPPKPELVGKVLLPILGEQFGRELESGRLRVEVDDGAFRLRAGDTELPLTPPSWRWLLEPLWTRVVARAGGEAQAAVELESLVRSLEHWPTQRAQARGRRHERDTLTRRLSALLAREPDVAADLEAVLRDFNGTPGDARSFDGLERLVEQQNYRLAHWRVAAHEINYRRFFDINDLAAIRVERDDVFDVVHERPLAWAARGLVAGFRVDHVDGLLDPTRTLTRLRERSSDAPGGPALIYVEKILAPGEGLPAEWPVDGTTGYEHLAATANVLVDADGAREVREAWRALVPDAPPWSEVAHASRRLILETALAAELNVLARKLDAISEQHRYTRDFTFASLLEALREVLSCFPVYRAYVAPDAKEVASRDRAVIARAVREAARRNPVINRSLFDFIESLLLLRDPEGLSADERAARRDFVLRLQQLTGPVMAKGLEDTAFYRHFPLLSLAEVGGDPDRLGASTAEFHAAASARAAAQPRGLSASATHDTKRGEDARARLHVLSELPRVWRDAALAWRTLNAPLHAEGEPPDPLTETFIYEALVGAWPAGGPSRNPDFGPRFAATVAKAIAEAKLFTSWINRDAAYEDAVGAFVTALLDRERSAAFHDAVEGFVARIATAGHLNSLAQTLLKVAAPGVPDIYWGGELWDFSFADPDNRRPVDFERRRKLLDDVRRRADGDASATARALAARPSDEALKLFVLHRALAARAARRDAFESAAYEACRSNGALAKHVVAFARGITGSRVIAATGRLFVPLTEGGRPPAAADWRDTTISWTAPPGVARYREALTARSLAPAVRDGRCELILAEVFADLPVALVIEEAA
ncbi:MAG TPA: malto-oligosyltrehalose synthase [Polyangia bacterium]|nr:malto-oligosyltrehalose synthase [Polyangia bacterium]